MKKMFYYEMSGAIIIETDFIYYVFLTLCFVNYILRQFLTHSIG